MVFYFDIIIPAYNEEESIRFTLDQLQSIRTQRFDFDELICRLRHIWVVDNASKDRTALYARQAGAQVIYCSTPGYGAACLRALDHLQFNAPDAVVFMDADGSDDVQDLQGLLAALIRQEKDLVIGSRVQKASENSLTSLQRFGNALSCRLMNVLFDVQFTDLGPFRVIRWSALQQLKMQDLNFGWTVEMQTKAVARHLRVAEIPVNYHPRYAGESKISGQFKASLQAGYKILSTIGKEYLKSHQYTSQVAPQTKNVHVSICILAKTPELHRVKTRLGSIYSAMQSCAIHMWCIEALWKRLHHYHTHLYVTHPHIYWHRFIETVSTTQSARWMNQLTSTSHSLNPNQILEEYVNHYLTSKEIHSHQFYGKEHLHLQSGDDLGTRMLNVITEQIQAGQEYVILLGSDCPHIPLTLLQQTQHSLVTQHSDIVIGPASDGGYYLIAVSHLVWPKARILFQEMSWGHDQVLTQTLLKARSAHLKVCLLPFYYDLDYPQDIERLLLHRETQPNIDGLTPELETADWKTLESILNQSVIKET